MDYKNLFHTGNNMKFMFIGGKNDFTEIIIDKFNADYFSRATGYNIDNTATQDEIAGNSINYDIVLLHTYTDNNSQYNLLQKICNKWQDNNKGGNIIVTGSIATYYENYKNPKYTADKCATDMYIKSLSKRAGYKDTFKISVIKLGMLDSKKSRQKPHFERGVSKDAFLNSIEFILNQPNNIMIPEIVIEAAYE